MKYRYTGPELKEYPRLQKGSCLTLFTMTIPELKIDVAIATGLDMRFEYPHKECLVLDKCDFCKNWVPLTENEENIVDRYEKRYKNRLFTNAKAEEVVASGDPAIKLLLANCRYYDITGISQEELLKLVNGMEGTGARPGVTKDKIFTVKNCYMSKMDQFEEGKRSLVVGIDTVLFVKNLVFKFYLGKNKKVIYEIESTTATELLAKYRSTWTNKKGRTVGVLPVKDFERREK